jgi:hypothetical protein
MFCRNRKHLPQSYHPKYPRSAETIFTSCTDINVGKEGENQNVQEELISRKLNPSILKFPH